MIAPEDPPSPFPLVQPAVDVIRGAWPRRPRAGIVLGSGLGDVAEGMQVDTQLTYDRLPGFPQATAAGHAGRLLLGEYAGVPTVVLQGRCHLYEGYPVTSVTFPVRVLAGLGVDVLVLTNAGGGLRPSFHPGDVMLIRDHISFQWLRGLLPPSMRPVRRPGVGRAVYDAALQESALRCARKNGIDLKQGTYVGVTGPNYETRAEYRFFRRIGGDAVGMSTVAEASVAAHLGLRTIGLSIIANVALPDALGTVTHEQVLASVSRATGTAARLMTYILEYLAATG